MAAARFPILSLLPRKPDKGQLHGWLCRGTAPAPFATNVHPRWFRSNLRLIQRRRDLVDQIALRVRLLQDVRFAESLDDVEIDIAGDQDDRQIRPFGVDGGGELDAAHSRHGEVRKDEIYWNAAGDQPKRLPS